jgi:hypothetical protein
VASYYTHVVRRISVYLWQLLQLGFGIVIESSGVSVAFTQLEAGMNVTVERIR